MCGRYRTEYDAEDWSDLRVRLHIADTAIAELFAHPSDDVRPSTVQPTVVNDATRSIAHLRWGLVPAWGRADTRPQINARSETAFEKPFWRDAIRKHRCVVATTGYYEWSGEPGHKTKHLFERPRGGAVLLAGLFVPPNDERIGTFALMTCAPNSIAASVHDRMPVILETEDAIDRWLSPAACDAKDLRDLLAPCSESYLVATPPAARQGVLL